MTSVCDVNYAFNTFIFNWVRNYDVQVNTLRDALESLQNKVKIYNYLTSDKLTQEVDKLSHANFELYNYIVVIILDNECEFQQFIRTSDNQNVLLHSEILTQIQTNPTLKGISRLFVIQKLLDLTDIDDENAEKISEMIKHRQIKLKPTVDVYPGLSFTIKAEEYINNFADSPFINVFSRNFQNKTKTVTMDLILNGIMKEIKYELGYKVNIEVGNNATTRSNLLFGNGVCCDVLRDFF